LGLTTLVDDDELSDTALVVDELNDVDEPFSGDAGGGNNAACDAERGIDSDDDDVLSDSLRCALTLNVAVISSRISFCATTNRLRIKRKTLPTANLRVGAAITTTAYFVVSSKEDRRL
jgi:hypothetical protein